ncbi:MAG: GNAT family N-acetyltransferase [Thainema sp.]
MQLRRFSDIQNFWQEAQDYLLQYEAESNLLLGISHTLLHYPDRYPDPPYLAIATSAAGKILAVAMRTPPHKLLLSKAQDLDAIALIAQDWQQTAEPLPGVSGLVEEAESFVKTWQAMTGYAAQRSMEMRIHRLTRVEPVAMASGRLRVATKCDRDLLIQWMMDFNAEIGDIVKPDPQKSVDAGIKRQSMHIWEDSIPVSWASGSQSLPAAGRIGPVYTPLEHRRKGYATACVAALSQKLLDQGCQRCYLFTDLTNPTSNHIYKEIGYCPVDNWYEYVFREC